jgi:UDP-N-acetylmuramoyl-tripeptide--D-alanyl-D-alanine ligase
MIEMTLAEVADAVGGTLHDADPAAVVSAPAERDSRAVEAGGLFVAVVGERVDGHDFAGAAVATGAVGVLAARPTGVPTVVVADPVAALGRLARAVRDRLTSCHVVGVTGSQGKTSTKDLLAHVLATAGPTVATQGSLNNEIGLPLTLLRAGAETRFLVAEMGARGVGHIRDLCATAAPDVGLVLNVGVAHLGEFGSREGIARGKGELVEALPSDGTAVLNADDPLVSAMAPRTRARVLTYGRSAGADVRLDGLVLDAAGRPRFDLVHGDRRATVQLQLLGEHQAGNATAAAAVALSLGLDLAAVAAALGTAAPASAWRMEPHELADGTLVLNDAYNANPHSMRAALSTLRAVAEGRDARSVAVLGSMRELGGTSGAEHEAVGRAAAEAGVSLLVVVGDDAAGIRTGALAVDGWAGECVTAPDADAAARVAITHVRAGDVVLVKASRAEALERVADSLVAATGDTAGGPAAPGRSAPDDRDEGVRSR